MMSQQNHYCSSICDLYSEIIQHTVRRAIVLLFGSLQVKNSFAVMTVLDQCVNKDYYLFASETVALFHFLNS